MKSVKISLSAIMASALVASTVCAESIDLQGDYLFTNWKPSIDNATFVGPSDTRFDFGFVAGGHLEGYASTDAGRPGEFLMVYGGAPNVGRVVFNHYDGTNWHDRVIIQKDGSAVFEGKITSSEIEVKTNVWADHVFSDGYQLMPLAELESFIKSNGHLPGVPNKLDVLEQGVNLGNMSRILLEKVEELSLHVIALKSDNELLKDRLNRLKPESSE